MSIQCLHNPVCRSVEEHTERQKNTIDVVSIPSDSPYMVTGKYPDPVNYPPHTGRRVSKEVRDLVVRTIDAQLLAQKNGLVGPEAEKAADVLDELFNAIATLEEDSTRLEWLDDRYHYISVTPATNMIGVPKGWTYYGPDRSYDSIGERCLDLREAVDKAIEAHRDR